ncbi:MAG: aspartyl protease family protein, partial [Phaeodactylibacter sp.]|nr:aspartyl protease family protein [Phaeodactylibacter sp.]
MRRFAYGFLLLLLFQSCTYFKNVKLLPGGRIERQGYVQTLPFIWRKDLIVVPLRLHGDTIQREFLFDTGAFNSKVEGSLAESLGLNVVTEKTNSTAQGLQQKIEVLRVDSLLLGNTWAYQIGAGKLNFGPTSATPCIAADGIIGANLIKLAHWKIDFEQQLLHFSDRPFEASDSDFSLPFRKPLLSGTPSIELTVNGKKIKDVLLDLGYNGGLVLPLSAARKVESAETQVILDRSVSGIYGTNTDSLLVKTAQVNVGGYETEMPVEFSALDKALLGNEFLKHFTVFIDYDNKKIHLEKQREVQVQPPRPFLVGIENDSLWVVTRTTPELPLRLGDRLLLVNGKQPKELFSSHCD